MKSNLWSLCAFTLITLVVATASASLSADSRVALTKKGAGNLADPKQENRQENEKVLQRKIVSYAPSNTELLYSLHADPELIGTCTYCDFPADAKAKEKVGTFISANIERLTRLKPDTVVLVSGQEALSGMLNHNGFHVRLLQNTKLSDIGDNLKALGSLTAHEQTAQRLADNFADALKQLHGLLLSEKKQPKVFYCVWPQPLLTIGKSSFLNDVVTACGGINIAASTTAAYPQFSAEKLIVSDPDVIILPYEASGKVDLKRAPWSVLRAVKSKQVFFLPEPEHNGLIRPTLRIILGLYWLSSKLHPKLDASLAHWRDSSMERLNVSY